MTGSDSNPPPPDDAAPTIATSGAAEAPTLTAGAAAATGARSMVQNIGRYRIVGRLGEGGMGTVFEAEQEHPRRRVALKIIRVGTVVDEQHVRMFQREVDTLARLKHPNIASIYEAGRTEAGEHYFAMELVRGRELDDYLHGRKAPLDAAEIRFRLRLFQSICAAVNYAHQRGVIHRDLKPSNIVIADAEGSGAGALPEVKILDFGLARITGADVEAATAITEVGVIKGTLPYMSPEQARGNPDDIDLRSDVYALGVILYEMLSGTRPYETQKTSIIEALRIICETPPTPLRQAWPGPGVPDADLQTITGKALEKEADRRYDSAAALAEDVGLYLDSRPILARAPSTLYQLRKFAQRNRPLVAGAAATLMALVAGIVVSTTFGLREASQRHAAEKAQQDTQIVADFQSSMLAGIDPQLMGRRLAEDLGARLQQSRKEQGASPQEVAATVAAFNASMQGINTTDAALQVIDQNILERASAAAQRQFADRPLIHAQLLRSIGDTYYALGMFDKAEPSMLAARALTDSVLGRESPVSRATSLALSGILVNEGRVEEAEPLLMSIMGAQRTAQGVRDTVTLGAMNALAMMYGDTGRLGAAESLFAVLLPEVSKLRGPEHPTTLAAMSNYAWVLTEDDKFAQAESLGVRALALRRRVLGNENPETMTSVNNLAVLYNRTGRPELAEPLFLEDYETSRRTLGEEHPDNLVTMSNLGRFYNQNHKYKEAEAILSKALATSKRVMPPGFFGTGITSLSYGDALVGLGRYRDAEAPLLDAHRILLPLTDPKERAVQKAVGLLVQVYEHIGPPEQAARWRAKVVAAP